MLAGFVLGAFAYGLAKGQVLVRSGEPIDLGFEGASALAEEVESRAVLGDFIAQRVLGMSFGSATAVSSALFGLSHLATADGKPPGVKLARVAETALAGVVYSLAYQRHGLIGATLTHLAHNLGVHAGAKR